MKAFQFNPELEGEHLRRTFGDDYFAAREIIGSFIEATEHEIPILQAALERKSLKAFSRITMRMVSSMQVVGLESEIQQIKKLRSHIAGHGVDTVCMSMADALVSRIDERKNLLSIEVDRLDEHIERQVKGLGA